MIAAGHTKHAFVERSGRVINLAKEFPELWNILHASCREEF